MADHREEGSAPTGRFRALAFSGGVDAVSQLGVAHALLVSGGRAPDAMVGVSVGAINAAAIAEILRAGDTQAQVDQLRKFLDAYARVPKEVIGALLPDAFEINARKPLQPVVRPTDFREERDGREDANRSRSGLIFAMNTIFGLRLTVRDLTLIINCILELAASAEALNPWRQRAKQIARLWLVGRRVLALAPLFWTLVAAAVRGHRAPAPVGGERRRYSGATARDLLKRHFWRPLSQPLVLIGEILGYAAFWCPLLPLAIALLLRRRWPGVPWVPFAWYLGLWCLIPAAWLVSLLFPPLTRQRRHLGRWLIDRVLDYHSLKDGLADNYALKQQLVACFDREYYGRVNIEEVLANALAIPPKDIGPAPDHPKQTFERYLNPSPPDSGVAADRAKGGVERPSIIVGAIAADVATGDVAVLPLDVPVVDALLAASAFVPIFPAVPIDSQSGGRLGHFIAGSNISKEAVGPLLDLLRQDPQLDRVAEVDVYPVHSRPVGGIPHPSDGGRCSLVEVTLRALQLQRLRDATIEQRLTRLYLLALPPGPGRVKIDGKFYVRAGVFPLGIEITASLRDEGLGGSSGLNLQNLVYKSVADGCRAALEGMIPAAIARAAPAAAPGADPRQRRSVPCRTVIETRQPREWSLPGSAKQGGPGLAEVCAHCSTCAAPGQEPKRQTLTVRDDKGAWPEWPKAAPDRPPPEKQCPPDRPQPSLMLDPDWPCERHGQAGSQRPLISLLFGGGVFRGVFHMGVLNALNELGVAPDIVAGSSVGSIIAAMIAQVFTIEGANQKQERQAQIGRLAATFLAIDKLVLTDRLADFIRALTVRAGDAHVSPRDLDLILRRYDWDSGQAFGRRLRRVMAGLERLLYLTPLEVFELAKNARAGRTADLFTGFEDAVQNLLERSGVGQEILGAEPLALLIRSHVLANLAATGRGADLFSSFVEHHIYFLATATNLHQARLEILGTPTTGREVSLLEGLLASSAFPALFRPRMEWEIFRRASSLDEYIDGGTMDNLPLDAVARFLDQASQVKDEESRARIARRPCVGEDQVPHLLFTASLEVDKTAVPEEAVDALSQSFLRLQRRARTFTYNRKVDAYRNVQRDLRTIYESRLGAESAPWPPLDLDVVAVKPRWLCSTFGFHPMLGFRRLKQAQSIAHGCASTLETFYDVSRRPRGAEHVRGWGIQSSLGQVDPQAVLPLRPQTLGKADGACWFRKNVQCPFSKSSLKDLCDGESPVLHRDIAEKLPEVYLACGRPETHRTAHSPHQ